MKIFKNSVKIVIIALIILIINCKYTNALYDCTFLVGYKTINSNVVSFLEFWTWGQYLVLGIIIVSIILMFDLNRKKLNYKRIIIFSVIGISMITLCLTIKPIIMNCNTKEEITDIEEQPYDYTEIDGEKYYYSKRRK